ncbi:MAG: glycosyltransferase family 10 domain-containing protein [Brevinema sp.]
MIINHSKPGCMDFGANHFMFEKENVEQADILFSVLADQYNVPTKYHYGLFNLDWRRVSSYPLNILENKHKPISYISTCKTLNLRDKEEEFFTKYINHLDPKYDLYKSEEGVIHHLLYSLKDYHYSIVIENSIEPNFFSEKLLYCFYSLTIPFYDGSINLEEYFPVESFIRIDINNPKESIKIIQSILDDSSEYQKRLPALKKARDIFLEKYQLFDRVITELDRFYTHNPNSKRTKQMILPP